MLATTVVLMGGTGFAAKKTYSLKPKLKGAKYARYRHISWFSD